MTSATIHTNLVSAIRERLIATVKATTGSVATLSVTGSVIARSSGSFVTDGFGQGDEIVVAGFTTGANNGRALITSMTATTLTVDKSFTTEAAGGSRTVIAGIPVGRAYEGEAFVPAGGPTLGQPYISDAYNVLPSEQVGIGSGGLEAHNMQAIFGLFYPVSCGRLAISRMAGLLRTRFRPGTPLFYGGESGILMAASVSGRVMSEPNWLSMTVTATVSARTID